LYEKIDEELKKIILQSKYLYVIKNLFNKKLINEVEYNKLRQELKIYNT
jgi:hypothetical protein